jgi:transposase InsO family protein
LPSGIPATDTDASLPCYTEKDTKVNAKRVYRLWRENGLSHRPKARKRRRIGSSSNSCVRLSPNYPNHVWSYDFLFDDTDDGRRLKWMPVIDEYTRECLVLEVDRS